MSALGPRKPTTRKHEVDSAQLKAEALRLRTAGLSYEQIADRLGYTNRSGAYKVVQKALQETIQEPADEYRTLHRRRLEAIVTAYWEKMEAGDEKAATVVARALSDLAELDGLNAPKRLEQKVGGIDDRPIPLVIAAPPTKVD